MTRVQLRIVLVVIVFTWGCAFTALGAGTHLLKARVADIEGHPMAGAKLFLYDSLHVRRPADFISPLSDRAGQLQIDLPPGKYWVVARYKSDGKYGPLMPGDKHSGEPLEVDMTTGGIEADFVVADIRELGQKKRASATDALRLKGRVVNVLDVPVAQAIVYANRSHEFSELPDFLSASTGDDGRYELFLPPGGTYYVGASQQFPLKHPAAGTRPHVIESGKIDIAIDINLTVQ